MMRGAWLALLFVATTVAGCLGGGQDTDPSDMDSPLPVDAPLASYLHDLSPLIDGLQIEDAIVEQYRPTGPDGFVLDTWILRPPGLENVPLVLEITPYYGGGDPTLPTNVMGGFGARGEELFTRGYALGISSVRGTGNSEGCFTQGGPSEAKDSAAVIEFLAAQPWSNGNVGLMGVSYPGTTPQDVWVEAPPSLKAVVPISGISDMYRYNFVNGVPIDIQGLGFNTYYWAIVGLGPAGLSGGTQLVDPTHVVPAAVGEGCTDQIEVQQGGVTSTLDGNKDGYWKDRDFTAEFLADPQKPRAAMFYIQGLQDWNVKPHMVEDWLPLLEQSGVPYKAWLGQWGHNWPATYGVDCLQPQSCRNDWWNQTIVAWFDQFLKGIDTGILEGPAVQVQDDAGRWRHEASWPPEVDWERFYLDDETLVRDDPGSGTASYFDYWGGQPSHLTGASQIEESGLMGPATVLFQSEPLPEDWTLSGQAIFAGNVTASGQRASLVLTLAEVLPDGTVRAINFAAQSLNHVRSLEAGDPDIAGQEQQVWVRFFPQDDVVHAGSRIALIAAGNIVGGPGPALIPLSDGSTITLDLATASLLLPVDRTLVYEDPQPFDA